jgi:hypothetical protein
MRSLFSAGLLTAVLFLSAQAEAALVCPSGSHSCGANRGCCPAGSRCLPVSGCSVRPGDSPRDSSGVPCGKYKCRTGESCVRQEGQLRCR